MGDKSISGKEQFCLQDGINQSLKCALNSSLAPVVARSHEFRNCFSQKSFGPGTLHENAYRHRGLNTKGPYKSTQNILKCGLSQQHKIITETIETAQTAVMFEVPHVPVI